MKKKLAVLLSLAALIVAPFQASAIQYTKDLPVRLGEWNWNFHEAKQIADEQHIPMVLFWGGADCTVCQSVEAALEEAEVVDWQTNRKLVMVFQEGTDDEMKELTRNPSGIFPYICVYWNRGDYTTTNRFSGVVVGSSHWPATGRTIGEHFIKSVELYISDYQPSECNSGDFACGDNAGNRLEMVYGKTEWVGVPLARVRGSVPFEATNHVVATFPRKTGIPVSTNTVIWAEGQETELVKVAIPLVGPEKWIGDSGVTLTLYNSEWRLVGTRQIMMAEDENCPSNPLWLGEEFALGKWTLDYDAATNASNASCTLVLFTGALWCPYCKGIEGSLLKPGSLFYDWAAENRVALAEFDQGRASLPATAAGTRAPRLMTYEPDPNLAANATVSGTGYLSRHMVERGPAEAVLSNTTFHTAKWLAPESTAARLSQPTILLVRDDEVVARFSAYRDADKNYDVSENLARLNDFLKLADGPGERNSYRTTTSLRHAVGGGSSSDTLQISDRTRFYALDGAAAGELTVRRLDDGGIPVTYSLQQGAKTLASGLGGFTYELGKATVAAGDLYLKVTAFTNTSVKIFYQTGLATSIFKTSFETSQVLVPEEGCTRFTPTGNTVTLRVVEDEVYRLMGVTVATGFEPVGGNLYRATASADVDLSVAVPGDEVAYQLWRPGEFAFVDPEPVTIEEKGGSVEIEVCRQDGVSGDSTVRVTVDDIGVAEGRYKIGTNDCTGAFVPCESVAFAWADGETGAKAFVVRAVDDFVEDGDQTLVLGLEAVEGATPVAEEGAEKEVTLHEDDKSGPGRLAITGTDPAIVRNRTLYAVAGSNVTFAVTRLEAADGEVGATFTVKVGGTVTGGLLDPSVLVWEDKCRGTNTVRTVTLALPEDAAGKTVTVTMAATGGAKLDVSRKSFTVGVLSTNAPYFAEAAGSWRALTKVAVSHAVGLAGLEGGKVTVRKLSGSLPGGVTVAYDARREELTFSGQPSRAGTFTATYQVTEVREGVSFVGGTFTVVFEVADLAAEFPVFAGKSGSSRTFSDVYFIEGESKRVAGVMTLTAPASGRLSAKYRCSVGNLAFSATGWETWDPEAGTVKTMLTSRKLEGYYAELTQHADGRVTVQVHDARFPATYLIRTFDSSLIRSAANPATDWRGKYTLAMPVIEYRAASDNDLSYTAAAAGNPCFTLKMSTKGAINAGRFTWTGWLPNGKGVSGSAVLTADGTAALVPVFFRNSAELFAALVSVKGGVADDYEQTGGGEFGFGLRAITAADAALNWWEHTDSHKADLSFGWTYDAYGSYYDEDLDLADSLLRSGVATNVTFVADMTNAPASHAYGRVVDVVAVPVAVLPGNLKSSSSGLKVSFNPKTGVVSGALQLPFETKDVRATYKAVVLPGWTGCGCHDEDIDLPFVVGAAWFADKLVYPDHDLGKDRVFSVKRGCGLTGETHVDVLQ